MNFPTSTMNMMKRLGLSILLILLLFITITIIAQDATEEIDEYELYRQDFQESVFERMNNVQETDGRVLVEDFSHPDDASLNAIWEVVNSSGTIELSAFTETDMQETDIDEDEIDLDSMNMVADLPCMPDPGSRSALIAMRFTESLDLSEYETIIITLRTDLSGPPYGGEFSVVLWEASSRGDEVWQSTRWFASGEEFVEVEIPLIGNVVDRNDNDDRNPWNHGEDFTIPFWETYVDGELDTSDIIAIGIRSNTTNEECANAPSLGTWISRIEVE